MLNCKHTVLLYHCMKVGYARVSTKDQDLSLQLDKLQEVGCEKLYQEKISGKSKDRPQLIELLAYLRSGDTVVVWKLDRLGRSLKDLIDLVNTIQEKGAYFQSLNDNIDTNTAGGKLIFHIFASLSEFEREVIRERTKAGLLSARARGCKGGRPRGLSEEAQKTAMVAETLYKEKQLSVKEICQKLSIAKGTFYKYLRDRGVKIK